MMMAMIGADNYYFCLHHVWKLSDYYTPIDCCNSLYYHVYRRIVHCHCSKVAGAHLFVRHQESNSTLHDPYPSHQDSYFPS